MAPAAAEVTPATNDFTLRFPDQRRKWGARTMTKRKGGRKTPAADSAAPHIPFTRYPINATVITTGPGVIIATATASRNWDSVSQWCSWTTPPWRNGTMARPLPKTNRLDFTKNKKSDPVTPEMLVGIQNAAFPPFQRGIPARTIITTTPAAKNSQTISFSVTAVETPRTRNIAQSNLSFFTEVLTSF